MELASRAALWPLAMTVILNGLAQVLVKKGVAGARIPASLEAVKFLACNGWVLSGLASQALAVYFWMRVLAVMDLSVAFPILASLLFLFVLSASWLFLGEKISLLQGGGVVLIALGIFCLTAR